MELYDAIGRRKSCRKYSGVPFNEARLTQIRHAIEGFPPLYPNVPLTYRLIRQVKGMYVVKAPHYLVISGLGMPGEQENAGFLFEQLVLWFDTQDIGCVWLGGARDSEKGRNRNDIIMIGFGEADEPVHRGGNEFKRKPVHEITNDWEDPLIEAVHLAPSGMNLQPWYFDKVEGRTTLLKQNPKPPASLIYRHTDLDMGITLCHYALACKRFNRPFSFKRLDGESPRKGYELFGEV